MLTGKLPMCLNPGERGEHFPACCSQTQFIPAQHMLHKLHARSVERGGWQTRKRWKRGQKAGAPATPGMEAAVVFQQWQQSRRKVSSISFVPSIRPVLTLIQTKWWGGSHSFVWTLETCQLFTAGSQGSASAGVRECGHHPEWNEEQKGIGRWKQRGYHILGKWLMFRNTCPGASASLLRALAWR